MEAVYTHSLPPRRCEHDGALQMNRYHLLFAVAGTAFIAGCASADKQAAVQDEDKEYVTGSRIPVRAGTGRATSTSDRQTIDNMMRKRDVAPGMPGG